MAVETRTGQAYGPGVTVGTGLTRTEDRRDRQAFRLLQAVFIIAPTVAGLDKFTYLLTDWDKYLAPQVASVLPLTPRIFMTVVGIIEIAAGLLVALKPRVGAYAVAAWLGGTLVNLVLHGQYGDIALRDFGLALGALALGRLAQAHTVRSTGGRDTAAP